MNRHDPTVLDHDELATLRRAAAMAHAVGTIGLRLRAGGTTIADVVPPSGAPVDEWLAPGPRIDPCGDGAPSVPFGDELEAMLICDDLLDVTVVHIEADPTVQPTRSIVRSLDEVLRRMLAAVGAAEVVDAVASQL